LISPESTVGKNICPRKNASPKEPRIKAMNPTTKIARYCSARL
jgi:hypothetical protein